MEMTTGLSLVHVSLLYGMSTEHFFVVYIFQGLGTIIGSILNMLFFTRFGCERQFVVLTLIAATCNLVSPWTGNIFGYAVLQLMVLACTGYTFPRQYTRISLISLYTMFCMLNYVL